MCRYFLKLAYDGTSYHGWQAQKNAHTIQELLTQGLSYMLPEPVKLTGAGRTDSGVHAREYFAHFDTVAEMDKASRTRLIYKMNRFLPPDIVIYDILPVKRKANARFSATHRTYKYYLHTYKNPFIERYSEYFYGKLDLARMNAGASLLQKTEDFTSFSKVDTDTKTNICHVTDAAWYKEGDILVFTIRADRFLRNMVRAIVGTLLEVGKGKMSLHELEMVIAGRNRSDAGESVAAKGLFLEKIEYPPDLFLEE